MRCGVLNKWLRTQAPQLMDAATAAQGSAPDWVLAFQDTGLDNIAAHGMRDAGGSMVSYFSFSQVPGALSERHAQLLQLIVPHMHVALMRALAKTKCVAATPDRQMAQVSPREHEVLQWLNLGKTNGEIAQILGVSPHTIKNEVRSILVKLRVNNRTRAVTKAAQAGLL